MFARRVATATATLLIGALILPFSSVAAPAAPDTAPVEAGAAKAPKTAASDITFGVTLSLPPEVAAFEGRVLVKGDAAEVVGVAPEGRGTPLRPEEVQGGWAIGAYDMRSADGATRADIVLVPRRPGRLQVRIVIDAAADIAGRRLELATTEFLARVTVDGDESALAAPAGSGRGKPERAPKQPKDLLADGKLDLRDVDVARAEWGQTRAKGTVCKAGGPGDANDDGCTDVVDIQSLLTRARETGDATGGVVLASASGTPGADADAAGAPLRTFIVASAADTADAAPGNGVCADASGQCTLRAAITEAEWLSGEDRIEFALPGTAPVPIQLTGRLPLITSRTGALVIDAYTQPGSRPNTATTGSNAIPGVELRGTGTAAREVTLFITSPGNTIRGFLINNVWRGIFLDGVNANNNRIVGNWLGFTASQLASGGQYGVLLNTGSNRNLIGTPALADRNVIGNWGAGIDLYGPGTDGNVIQNNLFCIRPSGLTAQCSSGIDHNFGPKNGLVGGTGPNERNVFGPTSLQGIELSHGYNPSAPPGTDFSLTYQINGNRVAGNWVGFRADGSYDAAYRSGLNPSSADNGQAINVYDGANDNIVENNHVASAIDGIQTMAPTAMRNIIRNNTIGESPLGQAAPMSRWGVIVRWGSQHSIVEGNTIKNAAAGGVGLLNVNNRNEPQSPAYNIGISRNIVSGTNGPAIDLFGIAGPDPNDPGDADTGANTVLNTPIITSASTSSVRGTGNPGAAIEVYRASRSAGQFGLPSAYLGTATVASDGTWTLATASTTGQAVTALQILPDKNTSELSPNVAVGGAVSEAPTITSAATTRFVVGTAGSFTVTSAGNPTPVVSMTGTLPAGVTFTVGANGTGALSGTPTQTGAFALTFTATNGIAPDATQSFTLQVDAAPTITSGSSATFVVGSAGNFAITATGRPQPQITMTGSLPLGVTFTPGTGSASISGTPAAGTDGTYQVTFTAANGVSPNATQQFTLTVNPAPAGGAIATDTFSRTVSRGWGNAEQGGAWTITSSPGDFSVGAGAGRISLKAGATRMARLAVTARDGNVLVKVTADKLPAGNSLFYYIVGRRAALDTEYRAKVRIASDGRVFVQPTKAVSNALTTIGPEVQVPGLVAAAGTQLSVRVQFVGANPTTVRMRVWRSADAEPSTWHATVTDMQAQLQAAGEFGLRAYLASVSNAPIVVSFDDLTITP